MNDPLFWVAILSPFFFFAITIAFGLAKQKAMNIPYRFTQYFPYELFLGKTSYQWENRMSEGLVLLSSFAAPLYLSFHLPPILSSSRPFLYFLFGLMGVEAILFYVLTWISLAKERLHLLLFFLEVLLLSLLHSAFFFFYFSKYQRNILDDSTPLLYAAILSVVFFLLSFVPLLNPKLKDYAKLESHTLPDGSEELRRPKIFPLAASEWWDILFGLLGFLTDGILMAWLAITLNQ